MAAGRRARGDGRRRLHGLAVPVIDVVARVHVEQREQEQERQEQQSGHEHDRVKRLVVPQVHEEERDEERLHRRDEHRDDGVGRAEVDVGGRDGDHRQHEEPAEDPQVQPHGVDVVVPCLVFQVVRVVVRGGGGHVAHPIK
ncbi:MAG: hypothetical protein IT374_15135 [Polyangiaceae bacterium]|nr:hypothetical protein [Polyangiaceae bacterium]